MNSIISLPKLVELLSRTSSHEKPLCEKFVRVFSAVAGDAIGAGELLRIKGFGQFRMEMSDGVRKVVFIPDKEMADAVNAPFECFEPVELAPGVSAEMLAEADDEDRSGVVIDDDESSAIGVTESEEISEAVSYEMQEEISSGTGKPEQSEDGIGKDFNTGISLEKNDAARESLSPESMVIDFGIDIPATSLPDEEMQREEGDHDDYDASTVDAPEAVEEPEIVAVFEGPDSIDESVADVRIVAPVATDEPAAGTDADEGDDMDQPVMPLQSGISLLTPEARRRHQKEEERARSSSKGFPWFWVAIAYIGGMSIGFSLGFFGHGYLTGHHDDDTIDLTGVAESKTVVDEVLDLTAADDELFDTSVEGMVSQPADTSEIKALTDTLSASQAASPEQENQSGKTVYDTVTPNRYLTTMAVEHYGNKVFWVYIFLDNQDKIKNPNNVVVGTKLRIPPKEQYDVSTDEKANIEAAKRKQTEIYNKYGNQ